MATMLNDGERKNLPNSEMLLRIPIGILRYKLYKVFIPTLIGKLFMVFIIVCFGRATGDVIRLLLGEGGAEIVVAVTTVLLLIILVVMYRIEWEKVFLKYVAERGEERK